MGIQRKTDRMFTMSTGCLIRHAGKSLAALRGPLRSQGNGFARSSLALVLFFLKSTLEQTRPCRLAFGTWLPKHQLNPRSQTLAMEKEMCASLQRPAANGGGSWQSENQAVLGHRTCRRVTVIGPAVTFRKGNNINKYPLASGGGGAQTHTTQDGTKDDHPKMSLHGPQLSAAPALEAIHVMSALVGLLPQQGHCCRCRLS